MRRPAPVEKVQHQVRNIPKSRPKQSVLAVGGYCPSTEAGIVRDCMTIENESVRTRGILTCITVQNNSQVFDVTWLGMDYIGQQVEALSSESFGWCKVGVLESHEMAAFIFELLQKLKIRLVWDPVLRSSSGFAFYRSVDIKHIVSLLHLVQVVTPNREECVEIFGTGDADVIRTKIKNEFPNLKVVMKGGVGHGSPIRDLIVTADEILVMSTEPVAGTTHGTGCVFAATIAASLAVNDSLPSAVRRAQLKVADHILQSNTSLK